MNEPDGVREEGHGMFGKMSVVIVKCADLKAMTEFYRDRLGLEVIRQGETWIALATGAGGELVLSSDGPAHGDDVPITCAFFGVPDLDAAHEALRDQNPSEIRPRDRGHGFWVHDPDGNWVGFAG